MRSVAVAPFACGFFGSACTPGVTAPASTVAAAQATRLVVSGNTALAAIGQTSQLAAMATFSDFSVKDVSNVSDWTSLNPAVVSVSSTGLLTVLRLGTSVVAAHYQQQSASLLITAAAPGTFVLSGAVDEPGAGGIGDVRVRDLGSPVFTHTDGMRHFDLLGIPTRQTSLRFERDDYESVDSDATSGTPLSVRMQQVIRLVAGDTVTAHRLAPNDLTYAVGNGERCSSCRLVRIVVPVAGMLHVGLTWNRDCAVTLGLWIAGHHIVPLAEGRLEVDADIATTAGEMIVYVDRVSPTATACHMPFTVATSLTP